MTYKPSHISFGEFDPEMYSFLTDVMNAAHV